MERLPWSDCRGATAVERPAWSADGPALPNICGIGGAFAKPNLLNMTGMCGSREVGSPVIAPPPSEPGFIFSTFFGGLRIIKLRVIKMKENIIVID